VHVKLEPSPSNRKRLKNYLWLALPTKVVKILPITKTILSPKLRSLPYYLDPQKYILENLRIFKYRRNNKSFRDTLSLKQKGLCLHCLQPLLNSDFHSSELEIHHIKSISEA
jgi:hypothetical protein